MAKLSAHGRTEIGTVYLAAKAKRYMSDGTILVNRGQGWKVHGKVKPHVTPQAEFARAKANQDAFLKDRPQYAAFRKMLHSMTGINTRWKLYLALQMMPDDPDGIWSEACDGYCDNVHADLDEVVTLCQLYKNAVEEMKSMKEEIGAAV